MGTKYLACRIRPCFLTLEFSNDIYRSEEIKKPGHKGKEKMVPQKKFKEVKNELAAVLENMRRTEELNKKREAEHRETIAAMRRRIEELEGRKHYSVYCIDIFVVSVP